MNELKKLKNIIRELHEACISFNSQIDQAEKTISEVKDHLKEIKQETKIREKSTKRRKKPKTRTSCLLQGTTTPHQQGNKVGWRMSVMK